MTETRAELLRNVQRFASVEGMRETAVKGVRCTKFSADDKRTKRRWSASIGIMIQGSKEIVLGRKILRCETGHYTVSPVDLPVMTRISNANPASPFLALIVDLDPIVLSEIAAQFESENAQSFEQESQALFLGTVTDEILNCAVRLSRLLSAPSDARVLGPLIVRELIYHVLKGPSGAAIRQFVKSGSRTHKISQAIHALRSGLSEDVDVGALAKASSMSRSAFFKHFKDVTTMSPIQYQKRLRLLEARRLMTEEGESAEGSAFKVGYKSASQFSREYSRTFGASPLKDALKLKKKQNDSVSAVNLR